MFKITHTAHMIGECWSNAEELLRRKIESDLPDLGEEDITRTFHGCLKNTFDESNQRGDVVTAFTKDLVRAFGHRMFKFDFHGFATGLVTSVTLHDKKTEGKSPRTGGDVGVVLVRPQVTYSPLGPTRQGSQCNGLLAQAKLSARNNICGALTEVQREVLPPRFAYTALLIYRYGDASKRKLSPFLWQSCDGADLAQVNSWLSTGIFPTPISSSTVIDCLASGSLGTDDKGIIKSVIAPPNNVSLRITIDWPDGKAPSVNAYVRSRSEPVKIPHYELN